LGPAAFISLAADQGRVGAVDLPRLQYFEIISFHRFHRLGPRQAASFLVRAEADLPLDPTPEISL
jgi:hypothetical protein